MGDEMEDPLPPDRQAVVLVLIANTIETTGRAPTLRQLSQLMGRPRTSSQPYVSGLIIRGFLEAVGQPGRARNLRLTEAGEKMVDRLKQDRSRSD